MVNFGYVFNVFTNLSIDSTNFREMKELEFQPDTFFRRTLEKKWFDHLKVAADFLGAKEENLVFVENATAGLFLKQALPASLASVSAFPRAD